VDFGLLGPIEARLGDRRLNLGPAKQRLVLAALLLEANRYIPIEMLVDLTWPDAPPSSARTAIHGRISQLRSILASVGGPPDSVALKSEGSRYSLRIDPDRVDVHRFNALLAQARDAPSDEVALRLYDQALSLWRGRPLDGSVTEEVRVRLCGSLEEAQLMALEERADAQLRLGLHRELIGPLTSLLHAHPTRERIAGQLALAFYRSDQSDAGLTVCRTTSGRLRKDLGIDPGPMLRELEQAILRNDESLNPSATSGITGAQRSVRTAGSTASKVFQVPTAAPGFTGRITELRRLTELLTTTEPPAMTIGVLCGPAGVGKTALAVHWGHQIADRYPDGCLHLNLRGYDPRRPVRPVEALAQLLRTLGVPPEDVPVEEDEAALLYRSVLAHRRVLVILDNAGSTGQVRPLLPDAARCTVLITSRDELRGLTAPDRVNRLRLDVLAPVESLTLLGQLIGTARISAAHHAGDELVALCAHLPLALRIAGTQLAGRPTQPIDHYVEELAGGNRINQLTIGGDSHAAVRTAFDLSYQTLAAGDRLLFRRLGLIPGPDITVGAAAAAACGQPHQAAQGLDRLAAAHLVQECAPGRYQFHDLLRLYAVECGQVEDAPDDCEAAQRGLLDYYLHNVDAAARRLYPHRGRVPIPPPSSDVTISAFDDATAAQRWLDTELPNLTAAIHHAASTGHRAAAGLLADALRGYFPERGRTAEWLDVASTALKAATEDDDLLLHASAELSLADLCRSRGRYPEAHEHNTAALDLARQAGWVDGESTALGNLGLSYQEAGDLRKAIGVLSKALELNHQAGVRHKRTRDLVNLGVTYAQLGDLHNAADLFHQAQALEHRSNSPGNVAMVLHCLGTVYRWLGRLSEAAAYLSEALTTYRGISDLVGQASILDTLAGTHADAGRYREAMSTVQNALALARQIGNRRTESSVLNTLGSIHYGLKDYREAVYDHGDAHLIAAETGNVSMQLDALVGMATAQARCGEHNEAHTNASQALVTARETDYRLIEGQALTALADAALAAGAEDTSAAHAHQALAIHRETGYRLGTARTLTILGHALRANNQTASAFRHWREALELFTEIGAAEAEDLRQLIKA
jgi:DNA-binding SARP family transcriptional activator/tetratricopeptide (TPR) repeat protein